MLPPGLGFNAVSERRWRLRSEPAMRSYWDWQEVIAINKAGTWPVRPRPTCCSGCARRSRCSGRRGWRTSSPPQAPQRRNAAAIKVWGLETQCQEQGATRPLTGVVVPEAMTRTISWVVLEKLRHVARHRPEQDQGQGVPDPAISATSTT
jgi:alanine-glyoxylate transaminase/serine-glyoxylate transaminase/serine-pyruvate transaminase